jgi:hypothetical protein
MKKLTPNFQLTKKTSTFAHAWRDGRVVDRGGLENRCTVRYRGFESLSLRSHGCSSVGRALVSKTRCRAFESLLPCKGLNQKLIEAFAFLTYPISISHGSDDLVLKSFSFPVMKMVGILF